MFRKNKGEIFKMRVRNLKNFKKVMLGAAMAAVLSMGTMSASAGSRSGRVFIEGAQLYINYSINVQSDTSIVSLKKNTTSYGMWGEFVGYQEDGGKVLSTIGKSSTYVKKSFSAERGSAFKKVSVGIHLGDTYKAVWVKDVMR